MTARRINPVVKQVLDFGPTIAFLALYLWLKDGTFTIGGRDYSGFIVAAVAFVPILLVAMVALWVLERKVSRMQVFTAVMVIVFGGLTAWFNDERFFKMKTTIVYGTFTALLGSGLLMGRSWLQWIMADMLPMLPEGWMKLTRRLTGMFAALAVGNEILWRNFSTETWVWVETFVFPVLLFVFLWAQIVLLQRYLIDPPKG
jgi:intracellular septation protein